MPQIYVSIGTNQDRKKNLAHALDSLYRSFGPMQLSPVYQSEAVGFSGRDFYNMVAGFQSEKSIDTINQYFKQIEKSAGRDHSSPKFSDRTLDIDLLNYGDTVCSEPIVLPREEILYHAFVLKPFNDIAPEWVHPVKQQSITELWQAFDQSSQVLEAIAEPIPMSGFQE